MAATKYTPMMTYITPDEHARLKKFAKKSKKPMTQIVREAISSRLTSEDPYTAGYNAGVEKSIDSVNNMQVAQMRFPSGKSFAELISEELHQHKMAEVQNGEEKTGG